MNQYSDARGSQLHQSRDLIKNTIQRASVKRPPSSGPEKTSPSPIKKAGGLMLSGLGYSISLILILALAFYLLF